MLFGGPWMGGHLFARPPAAAQALGLAITDVEGLCADLVGEGLIERAPMQ